MIPINFHGIILHDTVQTAPLWSLAFVLVKNSEQFGRLLSGLSSETGTLPLQRRFAIKFLKSNLPWCKHRKQNYRLAYFVGLEAESLGEESLNIGQITQSYVYSDGSNKGNVTIYAFYAFCSSCNRNL